MNTTTLKKKLKDDFEKILDDEANLETLNKVFAEIIIETGPSDTNESEKLNVKESKTDSSVGNSEVRSWEDFKKKMKAKYGY